MLPLLFTVTLVDIPDLLNATGFESERTRGSRSSKPRKKAHKHSEFVRVSGVEPCSLHQLRRFDYAQRDGVFVFQHPAN
jgi:hypothetical protein